MCLKMITSNKYAPAFCGKDAEHQLNTWNALILQRDYEILVSNFRNELREYIGELRTAQIFEKCATAKKELDLLSNDLIWFEQEHAVDYKVTCLVTRYCDSDEEFYALATEDEYVDLEWIKDLLNLCPRIDDYHPCESIGAHPATVRISNVFLKSEWDLMNQAKSDS